MIDRCDTPISVTKSSLTNVAYTITENAKDITFPAFIADPAWCTITYTYAIDDSAGESAVALDSATRIITFSYIDDLTLSGPIATDYTVTIIGAIEGENAT